jgi:1-acyl-sn-glycerol-3-phosphate acyltransferase
MPILFFFLGFSPLEHHIYSIYDFIADYKPEQNLDVAPVVASNHVSFLDIFYFYRRNMSFLAKKAISQSPLFGPFSIARQCIFVDRSDKKSMSNVLTNI